MKTGLHPTYYTEAKIVCSCGNTFVSGSTKQEIRVEICSNCHPVYTGVKRFVDTLGRVDKFVMAQNAAAKAQAAKAAKKAKNDPEEKKQDSPRTLKEMLELMGDKADSSSAK
jgi:large subunit ribosomal protein L31